MNGAEKSKLDECRSLRLSEAISDGRLYQTKVILDENLNLNYIDQEELCPLMRAFLIGDGKYRTRTAMVKLLLQQPQIDVNLKDKEGQTVLLWACKMNKLDLVKILFTYCLQDLAITTQDVHGNTPLIYAVENNNVAMVNLLVNAMRKFSLSVDQRNVTDKTAYYKAVESGHHECARILTDVGKASRDIKVNPFLEELGLNEPRFDKEIRVTGIPVREIQKPRHCVTQKSKGCVIQKNAGFGARKKKNSAKVVPPEEATARRSTNIFGKKRRARMVRPDSGSHILKSNPPSNGEDRTQAGTAGNVFCGRAGPQSREYVREISARKKGVQDNFLQIILDETYSFEGTINGRRSRSPMSSISSNSPTRDGFPIQNDNETRKSVKVTNDTFLEPTRPKSPIFGRGCIYTSNGSSPKRADHTQAKSGLSLAILEKPPNTLRNLLALRAEQQCANSSYRKGLVIPKYVPAPEQAGDERTGNDISSSVSENSTRSEAGKKLFNVAKKIGLSLYLNKRKNMDKEDS